MKRVYLAGPMSGIADMNYPAFAEKTAELRALGHFVVSPAELCPIGTSYADAMRKDIMVLVQCDTIYMMRGWQQSKGATIELSIARVLEMEIWGEL